MNLPEISVRHPITIYMMILVFVLLGVIAFTKLPIDLMPDIQNPTITVRTAYPGSLPKRSKIL